MIKIQKSQTADTRSCDYKNVTKEQLLASSHQHISDVTSALRYFMTCLQGASELHDWDKISDIDGFHHDFVTGFEKQGWWTNHRKVNRHHIDKPDGVPDDVDLIDVLEHVADCVMAGMARSGDVYPIKLPDELLQRAVANTVEKLKRQVHVSEVSV